MHSKEAKRGDQKPDNILPTQTAESFEKTDILQSVEE
jgi:hypothetical protein